jgi:hypothetical protein
MSTMKMVDDHAEGCCPSEVPVEPASTTCICCDCGFEANSEQPLPETLISPTQKLPEITEFSLPLLAQIEYNFDITPAVYSPQLRSPAIPVFLKNRVLLN